jgi:hypothetical protein
MSKDFQTVVRFPSDVVRQIDAVAERMSQERPGMKVSRAAVIRMMVMKGLAGEASTAPSRRRGT